MKKVNSGFFEINKKLFIYPKRETDYIRSGQYHLLSYNNDTGYVLCCYEYVRPSINLCLVRF